MYDCVSEKEANASFSDINIGTGTLVGEEGIHIEITVNKSA